MGRIIIGTAVKLLILISRICGQGIVTFDSYLSEDDVRGCNHKVMDSETVVAGFSPDSSLLVRMHPSTISVSMSTLADPSCLGHRRQKNNKFYD